MDLLGQVQMLLDTCIETQGVIGQRLVRASDADERCYCQGVTDALTEVTQKLRHMVQIEKARQKLEKLQQQQDEQSGLSLDMAKVGQVGIKKHSQVSL